MANRRRVSFSVYAVAGLIILFTVGYVVNMARAHMTPVIPTEVIRMGTNVVPQTISGIIFRDERVYVAPRDGQLVFVVGENERVRAGTRVASIQDSAEVAGINRDMLALEQRGLDIGAMLDVQNDPHVTRMNAHIREQVSARAHSFTSLGLSELYTLRDNLNHSIHNRNQLIINAGHQAGGDYARQQAELLTRLGVHSTDIFARSGGILSTLIDNFENTFTLAAMPHMTREQLNFSPDEFPHIPDAHVYANTPVFKIVGNAWYIAAYVPNELIPGFAVGQTRNIYVENPTSGEFISMGVRVHQITPGTRDSRVIFRNTRYVIDFMHVRNVNIRITQAVDTGLKIPNTAITSREFYVIPLVFLHGLVEHSVLRCMGEGDMPVPVPVRVEEWLGAHVYITGDIRQGDVLLDGQGGRHTLTEMRTIQGIYWAHNGYATFRQIHTDAPVTERGGTTLLCPIRNRGVVREFDTIVVDAHTVSEGDLIWGR